MNSFLQFSEFRVAPNCERFWMMRWVPKKRTSPMPSSQFDADRPVTFESLMEVDKSEYERESFFHVFLATLHYLSKATKTSQLNDYLLTFHHWGPRKWMNNQLSEQAGNGAPIFTNAHGIEYRGDQAGLSFKPLKVDRKHYDMMCIPQ